MGLVGAMFSFHSEPCSVLHAEHCSAALLLPGKGREVSVRLEFMVKNQSLGVRDIHKYEKHLGNPGSVP